MSMTRAIERNRARMLMGLMGADKINRRMSYLKDGDNHHVNRSRMKKMFRSSTMLEQFHRELKENPQMWKRVLFGDLKKDAMKAFGKYKAVMDKKREKKQKV